MDATERSASARGSLALLALGIYLTVRGYQSRDGDQAYRLPILLHGQESSLYANDPFVRAFDTFNPHQGYLALLDWASRPLGLSLGLFLLFALTFTLTLRGVTRLARECRPEAGQGVGVMAALLVLATGAGNIGTNHLFEPVLLDRLLALGLGWLALSLLIATDRHEEGPARDGRHAFPRQALVAALLGAAGWIHPSVGLQLVLATGALLAVGLIVRPGLGWSRREVLAGGLLLALGQVPNLGRLLLQGGELARGLPVEEFRLLALYVQGPQHLVPHLWRRPQWLAWGCFPALALLSVAGRRPTLAQRRVVALVMVMMLGLALSFVGIEVVGDLRLTLFQPFRMATVVRGLCLILGASRVLELATRRGLPGRLRAAAWVVGVTGDWAMVAALVVDLAGCVGDRVFKEARDRRTAVLGAMLACGFFLARHDTQQRHLALAAATTVAALAGLMPREWGVPAAAPRRLRWTLAAWVVPLLAAIASWTTVDPGPRLARVGEALQRHCRFGETPVEDLERLALWCRDHTPEDARFIAPPGAKSFRLWSRRPLAFNRAASPYHAAGLADWAERFRQHVGLIGSNGDLAKAYLQDRHGLERRFEELSVEELTALAARQDASYLVTPRRLPAECQWRPLQTMGRFTVYGPRGEAPPSAVAQGDPPRTAR